MHATASNGRLMHCNRSAASLRFRLKAIADGKVAPPIKTDPGPYTPLRNVPFLFTPVVEQTPELSCGDAAYYSAVELGSKKAKQPIGKTVRMAVLAGCYVSLGAAVMLSVGGNCPGLTASNPGLAKLLFGLFGLPNTLVVILVAGADLYTGNTAVVPAAVLEGRATMGQLCKSWLCSYGGNFIGCLVTAAIVAGTGLFSTAAAPKAVALYKTSLPFSQAFLRGVLGNWFVCLAVYMANACTTMPGKVLSVFCCIPAFVAMGLEHCVANQFIVPLGIMCGADISWSHFLTANLLPVTLGNTFAGVVCVACMYASIYGKASKPAAA